MTPPQPGKLLEIERGWEHAPPRLARADVAKLRRFYNAVHAAAATASSPAAPVVETRLHAEREDVLKIALAKLGVPTDCVLVSAQIGSTITVTISAQVGMQSTLVAEHAFRRTTPVKEWTRILGHHCRHAFGVLTTLRALPLASLWGTSKVP